MRYRKILFLSIIISAHTWSGCQKEVSYEMNTGQGNQGGNPPLGNNCKVEKIIVADSATGTGLFSLYTLFNSSDIASRVEAYDSIGGTTEFAVDLSYIGDTIRPSSSNEYYVMDASKRISEFHTYEDPLDTSTEKIAYTYTYDGSGYLSKKEISLESIPVPVAQINYLWNSGNMVTIDGFIPIIGQKIITADLEYDGSKSVKNFIPFFPDGFEFAPFVLAFDLGKKSNNVLKRTTMRLYDSAGNVSQTLVTDYKNYVFSSDGYLLEWFVEGDVPNGLPLLTGRTKFKYLCK
jgi:hypothetical protein